MQFFFGGGVLLSTVWYSQCILSFVDRVGIRVEFNSNLRSLSVSAYKKHIFKS